MIISSCWNILEHRGMKNRTITGIDTALVIGHNKVLYKESLHG